MSERIKGLWRLFQPFRNFALKYPLQIWTAYISFFRSIRKFKSMGGQFSFRYIFPVLSFKAEDVQSGGGHYFYQDIWALRHLSTIRPTMHYDVGSRFDGFTGQATAICSVTCIDLREPSFELPDFHFAQGDILKLPFEANSLSSLSCLHTIEHIGLGRYGDNINPNGYVEALMELQRVVARGGYLLLSMPVGKERVEFNAQRVLDPFSCIKNLTQMKLVEFSIVNDSNKFESKVDPLSYINSKYCCGLYLFQKN